MRLILSTLMVLALTGCGLIETSRKGGEAASDLFDAGVAFGGEIISSRVAIRKHADANLAARLSALDRQAFEFDKANEYVKADQVRRYKNVVLRQHYCDLVDLVNYMRSLDDDNKVSEPGCYFGDPDVEIDVAKPLAPLPMGTLPAPPPEQKSSGALLAMARPGETSR